MKFLSALRKYFEGLISLSFFYKSAIFDVVVLISIVASATLSVVSDTITEATSSAFSN